MRVLGAMTKRSILSWSLLTPGKPPEADGGGRADGRGCPDAGRKQRKAGLVRWRVCSSLDDRGGCLLLAFLFLGNFGGL